MYFVCEIIVKFPICHHVMSSIFNFFLYSPMKGTIVGETCGCWYFYSIFCVHGMFVGFIQQICVTNHVVLVMKHQSSSAFLTTGNFAD